MVTEEEKMDALVRMFLSYCRKTLVNARTDVMRERRRRRKREILFCEMRPCELESLMQFSELPQREEVFDAFGKPIGVSDERLASAIACLPETEQAIVLLSYFAGWSDRRIGEDMGCPRSTVQSRRMRAIARLGEILKGGGAYGEEDAGL